jgi:hypothetical protein
MPDQELDHFLCDLPALDDITAAEVVRSLTRPDAPSARALYPRTAATLAEYVAQGRTKQRRPNKRAA